MGLGPMFFLNLLGGAGKRYSERKSEEREKQRRLDEMEQQHKYQLELFQEKLSAEKIQNQADKIEEESKLAKENRNRLKNYGYTQDKIDSIVTGGKGSIEDAIYYGKELTSKGVDPNLAYKYKAINGHRDILALNPEAFTPDPEEDASYNTYQAAFVANTINTMKAKETGNTAEVTRLTNNRATLLSDSIQFDEQKENLTSNKKEELTIKKVTNFLNGEINIGLGDLIEPDINGIVQISTQGNFDDSIMAQQKVYERVLQLTEDGGLFEGNETLINLIDQRQQGLKTQIQTKANRSLVVLDSYKSSIPSGSPVVITKFNTSDAAQNAKINYIDMSPFLEDSNGNKRSRGDILQSAINYMNEFLLLQEQNKQKGWTFVYPKVKNVNGVGVLDTDNESAFYMPFNGATGIKVQY